MPVYTPHEPLQVGLLLDQPLPPFAGTAGEEDDADPAGNTLGPRGKAAGEPEQFLLARLGVVQDEEQALVVAMVEELRPAPASAA